MPSFRMPWPWTCWLFQIQPPHGSEEAQEKQWHSFRWDQRFWVCQTGVAASTGGQVSSSVCFSPCLAQVDWNGETLENKKAWNLFIRNYSPCTWNVRLLSCIAWLHAGREKEEMLQNCMRANLANHVPRPRPLSSHCAVLATEKLSRQISVQRNTSSQHFVYLTLYLDKIWHSPRSSDSHQ